MSIRAAASFDRRWTVFWATTYTFEPPFFESFLLPRLGEPPLNATVLVDADRHADAFQDLGGESPWRGSRANRDYLVRGVKPTSGAFHPKTYLFANGQSGSLLVGSGNLSMGGLETSKEVFTRFDATDVDDLHSIRAWRAWMELLVETVGDRLVSERWRKALVVAPWLVGPTGTSAFVTNWQQPLIDALLDGIEGPVDELHLSAPFYDEKAGAVRELIARTQPRRIEVLIGRDASVDGAALQRALESGGATVVVRGLDPDTYVHGKLVGLVWGERGRVLSGSANLSTAALLRSVTGETGDPGANVECGAIADITPADVRGAFVPPPPPAGLTVVAREIAELALLRFDPSRQTGFELRLRSAAWLADGRIGVEPSLPADGVERGLTNGTIVVPVDAGATTLPFEDDSSRFVWLVDGASRQLSNKVAIDEPTRLAAVLEERTEGTDRPSGLQAADLETPVGQMLARLHEACIFDFDDTPTAKRIAQAADAESDDPDFWTRLAREELRLDHRASRYVGLGGSTPMLDGVFLDIARMLDLVPGLPTLHPVADPTTAGGAPGTGTPWTPDQKLQVRLFNLLERWCAALSDPRLEWIDVLTPVGNFAALVGALRECWSRKYLPEHRVIKLVGVMIAAFVRGERRSGFLARLEDAERRRALAVLASSSTPAVAGALVYASTRQSAKDLTSYLFAWQPALVDGLALGVFRADLETAPAVAELTRETVSPTGIAERLAWASTYLDDARWSEIVSRETRLPVGLTMRAFAERFGATVKVGDGVDLLGDPRIVEIVRRALAYRRTNGCVVESGADRLGVRLGDVFSARIRGVLVDSSDIVTVERLEELVAAGAGFADLFASDVAVPAMPG